jgi:hypothetical protein
MEVLRQSVNAHQPGIYESGGGLFWWMCQILPDYCTHHTWKEIFYHAGETGSG